MAAKMGEERKRKMERMKGKKEGERRER